MISCWDFPDADKLLPHARAIAPAIAALQARCRQAGVPVIYANDNRGQWRSDFRELVDAALRCEGDVRAITQALHPDADDYFVLKPKHSGFYATPLELLLQDLGVGTVMVAGVASDQCVWSTVSEARMRDLDVVVPRDCVASQSVARNDAALLQFETVFKLPTTPGPDIRLPAPT
ncbi:MAG: cysteine hydrolase, partial [Comamonadaceae bacterium]